MLGPREHPYESSKHPPETTLSTLRRKIGRGGLLA
jgi:hypothetical protein